MSEKNFKFFNISLSSTNLILIGGSLLTASAFVVGLAWNDFFVESINSFGNILYY